MLFIKKLKPYFEKYKRLQDKIHNLMLLDWLIALLLVLSSVIIGILLHYLNNWKLPFIKSNSFVATVVLYSLYCTFVVGISIYLVLKRFFLYNFLITFDYNYLKSYKYMLKNLKVNLKLKEYNELKRLIFDLDTNMKETIQSVTNKEKITLLDSTALMWLDQNFYRELNKLHFISSDKKTKNHVFKIKEYKAIINKENLFVGQINNNQIEIEYAKLIPTSLVEKYRGVNIPNRYWLMSSNIFKLLQFVNNEETLSDSVLYFILSDLAFILSKWKKWNIVKLKEVFELFLISNMFAAFYDRSEFLNYSIRMLDIYEGTKLKNIFTALENNAKFGLKSLNLFYEKVIKKVIFDKKIVDLSQSIKNTILGRELILNEYFSSTSLKSFDNHAMLLKFKDAKEMNKYLKKIEPTKIHFETSKVFLEYLAPKVNTNKVDIRFVLTKLVNNYV